MLLFSSIADKALSTVADYGTNFLKFWGSYYLKVRMKGLEPSLLSELEPKSSASANSATSASVS